MFLDEKLLAICKEAQITEGEDLQKLTTRLIDECQDYYKGRIEAGMLKKSAKTVIDRTFGHWDSFVRMALSSNDNKLRILGELYKEHTLRKIFLADPELGRLYKEIS